MFIQNNTYPDAGEDDIWIHTESDEDPSASDLEEPDINEADDGDITDNGMTCNTNDLVRMVSGSLLISV